jgi:hypothetical protein
MQQSKRKYYRIVKKTYPDGQVQFFVQYRWKGFMMWLFVGWQEKEDYPCNYLQEAEFRLEKWISEDNETYDQEQRRKKAKTQIVS